MVKVVNSKKKAVFSIIGVVLIVALGLYLLRVNRWFTDRKLIAFIEDNKNAVFIPRGYGNTEFESVWSDRFSVGVGYSEIRNDFCIYSAPRYVHYSGTELRGGKYYLECEMVFSWKSYGTDNFFAWVYLYESYTNKVTNKTYYSLYGTVILSDLDNELDRQQLFKNADIIDNSSYLSNSLLVYEARALAKDTINNVNSLFNNFDLHELVKSLYD